MSAHGHPAGHPSGCQCERCKSGRFSIPAPAPSELEQTAFVQVGSDVPPSEWPAEFLARVLTGHADKHPYQPLRKALREAARRLSAAPVASPATVITEIEVCDFCSKARRVAAPPSPEALAALSAAPVASPASEPLERWCEGAYPFIVSALKVDDGLSDGAARQHANGMLDDLRALFRGAAPTPEGQ